jgi:CBS domain-containing protein
MREHRFRHLPVMSGGEIVGVLTDRDIKLVLGPDFGSPDERDADVPCETVFQTSDHPYEAIIATAKEKGCDLIMMASHGRSGVQAFLLGSETQKVLTHSAIPVLVFR